MAPAFFRTVYTYRYVQIESAWLGTLYFGGMFVIAIWSLVQCFLKHSYVVRPHTYVETIFWRYMAIDGNWFFKEAGAQAPPQYCDQRHWWGNDSSYGFWGSDKVGCRELEGQQSSLFYFDHNSLKIATSIAYGNEINATEIYIYKHIEKIGIAFQVNYFNEFETQEVKHCRAFDPQGVELENRWEALANASGEPNHLVQAGHLLLSAEDILRGVGRAWDDPGGERGVGMERALSLRLQGVELAAEVKLQNYNRPLNMDNTTECTIHFRVFRDQFTEVQRFHRGEELIAIQHGLRMRVVGSASIGYPSFMTGLQTVALGLCMVTCLGTVVEVVASMVHPHRTEVNSAMCRLLTLGGSGGVDRTKSD